MSVLAIFPVGTFPEPTEFLGLNRLNEMFAYDLRWGTGVKGELRASMMFKELTSVVVRGLPAFDSTTVRSFSSSQVSIVSMI